MNTVAVSGSSLNEMPPNHLHVMQLFLEGHSHQEIVEMTGQPISIIYRILKDPVFIMMKNDLLEINKVEKKMTYLRVVECYRLGLRGEKLTPAQIDFIKLCLKHIEPKSRKGIAVKMSAKDLILEILSGPLPYCVQATPVER